MVDAATLRERALAALAEVTDPEIPVLTIADLGILRDVAVHGDTVEVTITPTYSGCPAMNMITLEIETALARAGIKARVRTTPVARLDDGLAERGGAPQTRRVRHRAARTHGVAPRPVRRGTPRLPALRQRGYRTDQRIRLDRVQVAAPLPRLPRAVRRIQVPLIPDGGLVAA